MSAIKFRLFVVCALTSTGLIFATASISHAQTSASNPAIGAFTRDLKKGMVHIDVLRLQQFLNMLGYPLAQDGPGSPGHETRRFGVLTQRAVRMFQTAHHLPTTGFFGPLSRVAITKAIDSFHTARVAPKTAPDPTAIDISPSQNLYPIGSPGFGGGGNPATTNTAASDTSVPDAPTNLIARAATSSNSAVWLSWSAASDNVGVDHYTIYRNSVALAQTSATSFTDTGLLASTTYSYSVAAVDAASNASSSRTVYSQAGVWADGHAAATADAPQYPTLLNSYQAAPPWRVAGIEYAVGVPNATVLKDPSTIVMSGVSLNATDHLVTVSGSNITLDGYDFSLNGGWQVYVPGSNVTITRSYFKIGANANPPIVLQGSGGGTISYNTIDGNDRSTVYTGLINAFGTGTYTMEYNWIKNAYSDFINAGSASQGQIIRYNLFENGGSGNVFGAHGDWIQNYGASNVFTSLTSYHNTFLQNRSNLATQGFNNVANQGPTYTRFGSVNISQNTIILPSVATAATNVNYVFLVDPSEVTDTTTIDENYIDTTGVYYSWINREVSGPGPYTGTTTTSRNRNMLSGSLFSDQGTYLPIQTAIQTPASGAAVSGATVSFLASATSTDGVSEVRFKVGNTLIGSALTSSPYATTWDVTGLSDGPYTLSSVAKDTLGRYATTSISITVSNNPPIISSISSGAPTTTGSTISWTTNTLSTSKVAWGLTSTYDSSTSSGALSTSHSMVVTGLSGSTLYHFAVVSTDALGKTSTSSDGTFTTQPQSSYVGPGDVLPGASLWWGMRAYSRSVVGTNAIQVTCGSTDYNIATLLSGALDVATLSSDCGVQTIYLKQLYDQTGHGLHVAQTDQSHQATITLNCIGSLPCITSTTGSTYTTTGASIASPLTMVFGLKPSAYTVQSNILSDTNQLSIYQTAADTITTYDGATIAHTTTDTFWHAIQIGFGNYTSDTYTVDSTTAGFTGGSNRPGISDTVSFLSYVTNGYGFRGDAVEGGIWPAVFDAATTTAFTSNLSTYWGW